MEKVVSIGGKETRLVANGATPRLYRAFFKKDVFHDMQRAVSDDGEIIDAEVIENLAFIMAKQGGLEGYDIETWLSEMPTPMAVVEAADQVFELWLGTNDTVANAKKN